MEKEKVSSETLEEFAFSTGYDRGNYAAAYELLSLDDGVLDSWLEDFLENTQLHFGCSKRKPGVRELCAYETGCVLGFHSLDDTDMLDEVLEARQAAAINGWGKGILGT